MTWLDITDPRNADQVCAMVREERYKALSVREWKHRLKGLGISVEGGQIRALRRNRAICALPTEFC